MDNVKLYADICISVVIYINSSSIYGNNEYKDMERRTNNTPSDVISITNTKYISREHNKYR